jgi:acetyl-CoA carboxylase biotin carboxyl carrier protein
MTDANLFDTAQIRQLVALMEETGLDEVELTENGRTLRLRRPSTSQQVVTSPPVPQTPVETKPIDAESAKPDDASVIKSPMVGTFYHAASPEAAPFVKAGDTVRKGQVIGVIEAMKTMNQIEADKDGVLKDFLTDNAQPVEYGEPLLLLE